MDLNEAVRLGRQVLHQERDSAATWQDRRNLLRGALQMVLDAIEDSEGSEDDEDDESLAATHYSAAAIKGALVGDVRGTLACGAEHWQIVADDWALVTCARCKATAPNGDEEPVPHEFPAAYHAPWDGYCTCGGHTVVSADDTHDVRFVEAAAS